MMGSFPTLAGRQLNYGDQVFQSWHWHGLVWLRGQQIAHAMGVQPSHLNQWHARYAQSFVLPGNPLVQTAVAKLPDLAPPSSGRLRYRRTRLFSLGAAALLCDLVDTPAAEKFAAWLVGQAAT